MIKSINYILSVGAAAIMLHSCSYDNIEEYYKETGCDTLNVSFSKTIDPIIETNCKSCHGAVGGNGGVSLVSFADIKKAADDGSLLGTIRHESGFKPMPQFGPKLDDCTIRKIEIWINDETPNN